MILLNRVGHFPDFVRNIYIDFLDNNYVIKVFHTPIMGAPENFVRKPYSDRLKNISNYYSINKNVCMLISGEKNLHF